MKIEMGKQYRTRDGLEVRIYATDGGGDYPIHGAMKMDDGWYDETWASNGRYESSRIIPYDSDLVEVKPRIKRTYWLNIDEDGYAQARKTKEQADLAAYKNRLACVKIEIDCEEGHGL
jgi:hypothetical protein